VLLKALACAGHRLDTDTVRQAARLARADPETVLGVILAPPKPDPGFFIGTRETVPGGTLINGTLVGGR